MEVHFHSIKDYCPKWKTPCNNHKLSFLLVQNLYPISYILNSIEGFSRLLIYLPFIISWYIIHNKIVVSSYFIDEQSWNLYSTSQQQLELKDNYVFALKPLLYTKQFLLLYLPYSRITPKPNSKWHLKSRNIKHMTLRLGYYILTF